MTLIANESFLLSSGKKAFFTKEQVQEANRVSLIDLAQQHGFSFEVTKHGKVLHAKQSGGLYIFPANNRFHWFTEEISGGAIDFLMHVDNLEFTEAVARLLNTDNIIHVENVKSYQSEEKGELILPEKAENFKRVYWYLVSKRGIEPEIVSRLMNEKKIYQQKDYGNCVFVGYDEQNKPRYCAVRGTYDKEGKSFRMDVTNSDKAYPFVLEGKSNTVFVCEAPIDAMSHASLAKLHGMDWTSDSRISLGCLSDNALETFLKYHQEIKKIIFCLDNDYNAKLKDGLPAPNYGQVAAEKHYQKYSELGYTVGIHTPHLKDFNQDLVYTRKGCSDLNAVRIVEMEEEKFKQDKLKQAKPEEVGEKADNHMCQDMWVESELNKKEKDKLYRKQNGKDEVEMDSQVDGWDEEDEGFEM